MKGSAPNHYERAFEGWLRDHRVQYGLADERSRAQVAQHKIKSPDFLLYPKDGRTIIAEVKGRKFRGETFERLKGFECWVTAEDVSGLAKWQDVLGRGHTAVFVFAYKIENVDVDFDGREVFEFGPDKYVFFGIELDEYRRRMKQRSPKWRTVTLNAEKFRECAVPLEELLL